MATAIAKPEPRKICGSPKTGMAKDREDRAQKFATLFVKFIGDHIDLLVEVRADFLAKPKDETICGVLTFTEYCVGVLKYSEGHIRALIEGRNPASKKHDGSRNRKPKSKSEEQEAAKKPVTKSGPGSASHVNESHPQYQAMKAKGLLNDETEVEVEEVDVPEPSAKEKITIKRKDGSIIEEATYAVDDAVRQIVAFATSCLKYMNAAEKTEVIDGVIEKLRSERDFIHKDTPIVIEEPVAVQP